MLSHQQIAMHRSTCIIQIRICIICFFNFLWRMASTGRGCCRLPCTLEHFIKQETCCEIQIWFCPQKSSLLLTRTGGEKARKAYSSDIRSWTCRKDWNSHIQSPSPVHRMPKIKAPTEGRGTPTACTARDLVKIQVVMWLVYMRIFDWKKWESIFSYTNMSRLIYVRITLLGVTQSASSSCKCTCWWFGIPSALWFG